MLVKAEMMTSLLMPHFFNWADRLFNGCTWKQTGKKTLITGFPEVDSAFLHLFKAKSDYSVHEMVLDQPFPYDEGEFDLVVSYTALDGTKHKQDNLEAICNVIRLRRGFLALATTSPDFYGYPIQNTVRLYPQQWYHLFINAGFRLVSSATRDSHCTEVREEYLDPVLRPVQHWFFLEKEE